MDNTEPTALAYTPDDVLEQGIRDFQRAFPEEWERWQKWCRDL